jgi:hypothetical protein
MKCDKCDETASWINPSKNKKLCAAHWNRKVKRHEELRGYTNQIGKSIKKEQGNKWKLIFYRQVADGWVEDWLD